MSKKASTVRVPRKPRHNKFTYQTIRTLSEAMPRADAQRRKQLARELLMMAAQFFAEDEAAEASGELASAIYRATVDAWQRSRAAHGYDGYPVSDKKIVQRHDAMLTVLEDEELPSIQRCVDLVDKSGVEEIVAGFQAALPSSRTAELIFDYIRELIARTWDRCAVVADDEEPEAMPELPERVESVIDDDSILDADLIG